MQTRNRDNGKRNYDMKTLFFATLLFPLLTASGDNYEFTVLEYCILDTTIDGLDCGCGLVTV